MKMTATVSIIIFQ